MTSQITVLGSGLVGSAIIQDLAAEPTFSITAVDISSASLKKVAGLSGVSTREGSVKAGSFLRDVCNDADLVINAVPGFMGFDCLKELIKLGKNVVDISFFPEDAFELEQLALDHYVTAVVDCGVAPGLCNIQAGYVQKKLDFVHSYVCYVGGLPRERTWPFEYKAVFSPIDVIEEYTRPARFVEHGELITKAALTDLEKIDFPGVGTLESFNTDGLRSLIFTLNAPFKKEKTLRYPGHVELMRAFRESGFFETDPVMVGGQSVVPLELTSKLLFDKWKLEAGEEDLTVMQVSMTGEEKGRKVKYTFDLFDLFDKATNIHSMARTTGYTCTIVARQVLSGLFNRKGICPPEYVGETEGCYEDLKLQYAERGIQITEQRAFIDEL